MEEVRFDVMLSQGNLGCTRSQLESSRREPREQENKIMYREGVVHFIL